MLMDIPSDPINARASSALFESTLPLPLTLPLTFIPTMSSSADDKKPSSSSLIRFRFRSLLVRIGFEAAVAAPSTLADAINTVQRRTVWDESFMVVVVVVVELNVNVNVIEYDRM